MIRVSELNIYPIKSCKGTALSHAAVGTYGLEGDRALMVTEPDGHFVTQRELSRMALIHPQWSATGGQTGAQAAITLTAPDMPALTVPIDPQGKRLVGQVWKSQVSVADQGDAAAAWLSTFLGTSLRLVAPAPDFQRPLNPHYAKRESDTTAFADGYPELLISQAALDDLNVRLVEKGAEPVPMNRFRPNIVVSGCEPFAEDTWAQVRIGTVVFDLVKPCPRCPIPTIDQEAGVRTKEPIKTLNTYRRTADGSVMFGQNLIHANTGLIQVGDAVEVLAFVTDVAQ